MITSRFGNESKRISVDLERKLIISLFLNMISEADFFMN